MKTIIYIIGALVIAILALVLFPKVDTTLFGVGVGIVVSIYTYFFRKWEMNTNKD